MYILGANILTTFNKFTTEKDWMNLHKFAISGTLIIKKSYNNFHVYIYIFCFVFIFLEYNIVATT